MRHAHPVEGPLWLASRSDRRRRLLNEAHVPARVMPAAIDEAGLVPGAVEPRDWVMALAWMKARWVAGRLAMEGVRHGTVLGADTLCLHDGDLLGKPTDAGDARRMLERLRSAEHETMTGVCLLDLATAARSLFVESARVRWGHVPDDAVAAYVASGEWRGKAGAYNLVERIDEGWPVTCDGDPTTVMGLPMDRLSPWLAGLREP